MASGRYPPYVPEAGIFFLSGEAVAGLRSILLDRLATVR
jgi:hypothetical protein